MVDKLRLTPIQARLLAAIERRLVEGESSPSYRELCEEFGWSSTGTVRDHLRALRRKGYVETGRTGHRCVKLTNLRIAMSEIPVIGRVTAGTPVLAEENVDALLPVPAAWTRDGPCFAVRVIGDSMVGAGIFEGDHVVVRQQVTAKDDDIVVATLDAETTLKRLGHTDGRAMLFSENPLYKPIEITMEEPIIQGVVVGLMRVYC